MSDYANVHQDILSNKTTALGLPSLGLTCGQDSVHRPTVPIAVTVCQAFVFGDVSGRVTLQERIFLSSDVHQSHALLKFHTTDINRLSIFF